MNTRTSAARAILFAALLPQGALAASYTVGDRVEAAPQADKSKWELCEVTAVLPDGKYELVCGELNAHLRIGTHWIRPHRKPIASASPPETTPK